MTFFLQLVVTGFALGMVYALVAIGFVIILKCSNAFNIAQGHFVMIGGYLGYTFLVLFRLTGRGHPCNGSRSGNCIRVVNRTPYPTASGGSTRT